jgi:pilus assembly protein CpaE
MSSRWRACLYSTDPASAQQLRQQITAGSALQLVEDVDTPEDLAPLLRKREVSAVFFHLDPDPGPVLEVVDQVSIRYPELALIALSRDTHPAAILAATQGGCDQFLCVPIDPAELGAALARVASRGRLSRRAGRCICVTGATGGSGATSVACGLALEIGRVSDTQCVLVDLELQFGTVAVTFDCEPKYNLYDLAKEQSDGELDRWIVEEALTSLPYKVSILPRPETIKQQKAITPEVVGRVIELLTANFENVVVDLPRRIDPCTITVLEQADLVLVVCQLLVPSIGNAERYFDAVTQLGVNSERVEIVVNRHNSASGLMNINDIEKTIDKPVFARIPNDFRFVSELLDLGQPAVVLEENNPVQIAIQSMAQRILGTTAELVGQAR